LLPSDIAEFFITSLRNELKALAQCLDIILWQYKERSKRMFNTNAHPKFRWGKEADKIKRRDNKCEPKRKQLSNSKELH